MKFALCCAPHGFTDRVEGNAMLLELRAAGTLEYIDNEDLAKLPKGTKVLFIRRYSNEGARMEVDVATAPEPVAVEISEAVAAS